MGFVLCSCASTREQVWKERRDPGQVRTKQWAKLCEPYAKMSYLAYRSASEKDVDISRRFEKDLAAMRWRYIGKCEPRKDEEGYGLYFDVWQKGSGPQRELVFAFRGTEFNEPSDWVSNFRWLRWVKRGRPDQYNVGRSECMRIMASLMPESDLKKVRVVTTGHSLGAGIAESVLYGSVPYVDQAIVFDPSPVTGFMDLDKNIRDEYYSLPYRESFSGARVVRVYAKGEILQYVRNTTQVFYHHHTLIHQVEFDIEGGKGAITKHSMRELADSIHRVATATPVLPPPSQKLPYERKPKYFQRLDTPVEPEATPPAGSFTEGINRSR